MTRAKKIHKLANAIREYRGAKSSMAEDAYWLRSPKPSALARVVDWLSRLKLNAAECVQRINAFKSYQECGEWLKTL